MPTDLEVVFALGRDARAQSDANITMLLICGGLCLALFLLLLMGDGIGEALELRGKV